MHLAKIRKKGRNVLKRVGSKIDGRLNCYMHYFKIESTFLGHLRGHFWGPVPWWALSVLRSSGPSRKAGVSLNPVGKVIYPKYSKHWLYTVAHTIDSVCSKILNNNLNHGLCISLSSLYPAPYIELYMC